jgi:hypothetical protein
MKPSKTIKRHRRQHNSGEDGLQLLEGLHAVRSAVHLTINFNPLRLEHVRVMCDDSTGARVIPYDGA